MAQPSFDSILNAVMLAESGGRRYDSRGNLLTSDKGAKGEMQVMPRTAKDPGFGVEPAKSSSPDELARVGRDYLRTMLDRYGSLDKALVAYNWGPKNADAWIAKGADPAKLPDETKKYVSRVQSTLSAQPRTTAQAQPEAAPAAAPARGAPAAAPVRVSEARPADLGPSYQAALALSFLSDEDEKESGGRSYDERQPSAASQWLARETRKVSPESLAMPFRSPFAEPEPEPVKAASGGFIAVGYEDGGEVDAVASKSTEQPSRPEPFRIPPGQTEARLREFNRLDPATQSLITRDDPRVEFALTPAPASVSAPYTLSTMPGARALYDQTLAGTTTGGYVHPALKMQSRAGKEVAPQDVVFLRPGRDQAQELQSRAHEAEHLLAKRGLGDATAINDKFDELMKDSKARRSFVEGAVSVQPYLEKTYGTKSSYFMPEMLAFQDKRGRGANLLYEQFAELAAIEQATGKDLTKDPELRKTIFKDKKVREVYNALTGLRQTRLDARDLSPYTPIPEKPEGMMEFIRSKLGFANGGDVSADSEEDILARAQAAAREGQAYRDMQEYLKARDAMPEIKAGSLPSQTAAEFQRTILPVGAGTIKINRGRLTDRTRETLPATLTHELAHAVDRQISQQAAEQAGMPNQFTEAYRKLVGPDESRRADIARKLDPAWEKRNRSYRSSPRELAGHGMGAFVDNAAQTPGPGHVDATAATELAILMDLANRNVDKKPKGLEKIPAFLRGIGYAEGGEAKSDEPTAEELERASKAAFGIVPSSGKGRKQSRVSEALQSGEAQKELAKGLTMLPQNVVGAPVDIATLVARPFGYNVEKPVMGSEWLKEKSRAAGLAFQEPEDPTLRAFFTAGDISSNLINPAGATRTAVRGAEKTGEAAKALAEFATRPVERDPFLSGPMGAQRGAIRLPGGHFQLERTTDMSEGAGYIDPISPFIQAVYSPTRDKALDEWFNKRVTTYFRRDLGTERDPFVLAAEQGRKTHHALRTDVDMDSPYKIPLAMQEARRAEGMDPMGIAKTPRGQRLEYASDRGIVPSELQDVPSRMIPPNLRQFVETDPTMRLYSLGEVGDLQLGSMKRELFNMRNQGPEYSKHGLTANIPQEYRIPDSALQGLTLDQASERVALFQDWKNKTNQRLAAKAIKQDPDIARTQLSDGSVWAEPPDLIENPRIRDMVLDVGCAGGWCTKDEANAEAYGAIKNRLAILFGSKGSPEAQLTITRNPPDVKDFLRFNPEMQQLFGVTPNQLYSMDVRAAIYRSPQFMDWMSAQPPNMSITEIKGAQNKRNIVDQPYVKKVQEYVQNLDKQYDLLNVENLKGIGLEDLLSHVRNAFPPGFPIREDQISAIQKEAVRLNGGTRYISVLPKGSGTGPDLSSMNELLVQAYKNVTQR